MAVAMETYQKDFGGHAARLTVFHGDGESWFKAKEAAIALGYQKPDGAIRKHVDADDKKTLEELMVPPAWRDPLGYNDSITTYISESGLYSLILRSRLPCAKAFQRWVTSEVLPSIRRSGRYEARPAVDSEWDRRSARLAALSSAYTLASALAVPLDDTHRQAALTAINEVLLPEDRRQTDMIDAAEFLRRKGHAEDEIARMASEFGRALRTATPATSDTTRNVADFGAAMNAVRKYHCRDDALFLEEVYAAFRNRDLFINTTRQHEARRDRMYRAVHESLRGTRGFRQDRERSPRR